MLARADHSNMGSLSKQHEKTKWRTRWCISSDLTRANLKKFPAEHAPGPPFELFGASGTRNTGHLRL